MHDTTPGRRRGTTRRNFLIGTGAAAGLAIGYALWPRSRAINWTAGKDETLVNAWVKIGTDGRVIVAVPQAEMGQGVFTALPQIFADELGADWATVGVEPAPLNPIYANRGMATDMVEGLPSMLQGFARWATAELAERFDLQMTGGSTSVRGFHDVVRDAGAAAREMLCKAAARDWDADWRDLTTENGFIIHGANRARFAEFAGKAALEDVPSSPQWRPVATRALMGKPVARLDVPAKTDGSARFGIDVRLPGMVYAAIRTGGAALPALASVDHGPAKGQPGVVAIVNGPDFVAVVADGWWRAKSALDLLEPQFTLAPKPAGPWIEPALKAALASGPVEEVHSAGEGAKGLTGGDIVTADYTLPFLAHAALEPMNTTVRLSDDGKRAEVWAPTQSLTVTTWAVARALGLEDEAVTVYPTLIGGGFGVKAEPGASIQAALIAKAVKRPVQLIWSREEDFGQDKWRPAVAARMRGKVAGGSGAAWSARIAVPDVASSAMGRMIPAMAGGDPAPNAGAIEGAAHIPYAFADISVEHALVNLPVPLGFWRSVGHSFAGFIVESFVDELAYAAKQNPYDFRLALLKDAPRYAAVLKAAVKLGGLPGPVEAPAGVRAGRGVAIHKSFGSIVAEVAEVEVKPGALRVRRVAAAIDCGPVVNPAIVRSQIESGILFGLSAALYGKVGFEDGRSTVTNFDGYPLLGLAESPAIDVVIVGSDGPIGGVGEPGTPPIAPAVANAIYAATGTRLRDLPLAAQA